MSSAVLPPILPESTDDNPFQTEMEFLDYLMTEYLKRIHQFHQDNYDAVRFSFDGVDRSGDFALDAHKQYLYFVMTSYRQLFSGYKKLADSASRELFLELILYRLLGHLHSKLPNSTPEYFATQQRTQDLSHTASSMSTSGIFGPLRHYEAYQFEAESLKLDCWPIQLAMTFEFLQYYYDDGGVRIAPEVGEHVIDAGACFGDTALAFATSVGETGKVYSFEPLANNLRVLQHNLQQNTPLSHRIHIIPAGAGQLDNEAPLLQTDSGNQANPGFNMGNLDQSIIPIRSIDSLVAKGEIEKVDFIKMDIEGFELQALRGAEQTIRQFRPKLAISAYHRHEDFFVLADYIESLGLDYKFHLGHYTVFQEETILYAA